MMSAMACLHSPHRERSAPGSVAPVSCQSVLLHHRPLTTYAPPPERTAASGRRRRKADRPLSTRSRRSAALNMTTVAGSRPAAFGRQSGRTANAQITSFAAIQIFRGSGHSSRCKRRPRDGRKRPLSASRRADFGHPLSLRLLASRAIVRIREATHCAALRLVTCTDEC